jgi:hypothetical protein
VTSLHATSSAHNTRKLGYPQRRPLRVRRRFLSRSYVVLFHVEQRQLGAGTGCVESRGRVAICGE